jgi:hypothetical protein
MHHQGLGCGNMMLSRARLGKKNDKTADEGYLYEHSVHLCRCEKLCTETFIYNAEIGVWLSPAML